jgi:hypothetical protein
MLLKHIWLICVSLSVCTLVGMEKEEGVESEIDDSKHYSMEHRSLLRSDSQKSTSKKSARIVSCSDTACDITQSLFFCVCGVGGFVGVYYTITQVLFPYQSCQINVSPYPVCGSRTSSGIDQNQAMELNFYGNLKSVPNGYQSSYYKYAQCKQPFHQICTNFDSSQFVGLPEGCDAIEGGKIWGVVSGPIYKKTAVTNYECVDATIKRFEENFNTTGKRYCKLNPTKVGFNVAALLPLMLHLYLVDADETSLYVSKKRWDDPNVFGGGWGTNSRCVATWTHKSL